MNSPNIYLDLFTTFWIEKVGLFGTLNKLEGLHDFLEDYVVDVKTFTFTGINYSFVIESQKEWRQLWLVS